MSLFNEKIIHGYQEDWKEFKWWEKVQIKAEFLFSFHLGNNYSHMQNFAADEVYSPTSALSLYYQELTYYVLWVRIINNNQWSPRISSYTTVAMFSNMFHIQDRN